MWVESFIRSDHESLQYRKLQQLRITVKINTASMQAVNRHRVIPRQLSFLSSRECEPVESVKKIRPRSRPGLPGPSTGDFRSSHRSGILSSVPDVDILAGEPCVCCHSCPVFKISNIKIQSQMPTRRRSRASRLLKGPTRWFKRGLTYGFLPGFGRQADMIRTASV